MNLDRMTIPEDVRATIQKAANRGESVEALSQAMVNLGLRKVEAIKLLRETTKMGLGDAKAAIHYSPAWAFRRASDEAFHDELYDTLTANGWVELAAEEPLKTGTGR